MTLYASAQFCGFLGTQISESVGVGFPLARTDDLTAVWVGGTSALLSQNELRRFIALLQAHIVPVKKKPAPKKPLKKKRRK